MFTQAGRWKGGLSRKGRSRHWWVLSWGLCPDPFSGQCIHLLLWVLVANGTQQLPSWSIVLADGAAHTGTLQS